VQQTECFLLLDRRHEIVEKEIKSALFSVKEMRNEDITKDYVIIT
jgi:hypothetical protein